MPLFKGKSKAAFSHNVEEEMDAGKPQKQSLAIAYKMKRKPMAHGGETFHEEEMCEHGGPEMCAMGCYADGGEAEVAPMPVAGSGMHDQDMVGRIMKRRGYSEGGKVANQDEIEAGFMPNEFDDLHLRDDLESSYTGANSGDELSSPGEDERRRDMVDRVMLRRRKQTNPRPA